jgi:hypothetical protein
MDYKPLEENCHECGKYLHRGWGHMTYHDSRFCSVECRTKYHNARKKLKAQKDKIAEFIGFLHEQMKKGGDLALEAGMVNDMLYDLTRQKSGVKIVCRQCGQRVMWKPKLGEKCQFCGDSDWQVGDKQKQEQE